MIFVDPETKQQMTAPKGVTGGVVTHTRTALERVKQTTTKDANCIHTRGRFYLCCIPYEPRTLP